MKNRNFEINTTKTKMFTQIKSRQKINQILSGNSINMKNID